MNPAHGLNCELTRRILRLHTDTEYKINNKMESAKVDTPSFDIETLCGGPL